MGTQTRGLWSRSSLRHSRAKIHTRGSDVVVPIPRRSSWLQEVLHVRGRVEHRLYFRRNVHWSATVSGHLRKESDPKDFPHAGYTHQTYLPWFGRFAAVQARLAHVQA